MTPLFIATERFDPSDGDRWQEYCRFAQIPQLIEVVSLDRGLCPRLVKEIKAEDWGHIVNEDWRLDYFCHLDYLLKRVAEHSRRNVLGLYRNPDCHITRPPGQGDFEFVGYDLIEEMTQVSALTNCGGFPEVFTSEELNAYGLIQDYGRAAQIAVVLADEFPEESHADCELYAIWRLSEARRNA